MRNLSSWCQEYRSSRCIMVPRGLSRWCLMLLHSQCHMSSLSKRSPSLTPIVYLFFINEILMSCIMQRLRHQDPQFLTNVEVEAEHKLVNL
jgi:hypothetical protein